MSSQSGPGGPDGRWSDPWPPEEAAPDEPWSGNGHGHGDAAEDWSGNGHGHGHGHGGEAGAWSPEVPVADEGWSGTRRDPEPEGAWSPQAPQAGDGWSGNGHGGEDPGAHGAWTDDGSGDRDVRDLAPAPIPERAPASDPHRQAFVPAPDQAADGAEPWRDDAPGPDADGAEPWRDDAPGPDGVVDPGDLGGPGGPGGRAFIPPPDPANDPPVPWADEIPPAGVPPEPAPDLRPFLPPRSAEGTWSGERPPAGRRRRPQAIDRRRLAVVYDVEGPRVRLGVAWFLGALAATIISPFTAAIVYAVAAGMAARQIARAWGSISWQADMAAGLAAVPVLAALGGVKVAAAAFGLAAVVAAGATLAPDGARMRGPGGRMAAAGILWLSLTPAIGAGAFVLVRSADVVAAVVLLLMASAYEVGDYIVGSGAGNPVEGPLAGITTSVLIGLPLALLLVKPFDDAGTGLLVFAAAAMPFGQILASAVLPGAAAHAPALRRIDTLLLLAPLWAVAVGVH